MNKNSIVEKCPCGWMAAELAIIASNVKGVNDRMEHDMFIHTFDTLKEHVSSPQNLIFLGLCLAGKPCERFAQIVGNFIDFLR